MKKIATLALAFGLTLSLSACGGDPVTLASQTVNGISIDVPSDFGAFEEQNGGQVATNEDQTGVITISAKVDGEGMTLADMDQDTFVQLALNGSKDAEIVSYDNAASCNGIPAVIASYKLKNSNNVNVVSDSYILFYEDGTFQAISVGYTEGGDASAETNSDAIGKSIKAE